MNSQKKFISKDESWPFPGKPVRELEEDETWMEERNMDPEITKAIIKGLKHWTDSEEEPNLNTEQKDIKAAFVKTPLTPDRLMG